MKIDTEYKSLDEIDPVVVGYYSEEKRKRVTGYTDEEEPKPIYEDYTVIVLNKPDTVLYSEVAKRKGERKSEAVVMAELDRAIGFEEFLYKHDLYLQWVTDYAKWEEEQPTEEITNEDGKTEAVIVPAPTLPQIDLAKRREHYKVISLPPASECYKILDTYDVEYNDEEKTETRTYHVENKSSDAIALMHSEKAIQTRREMIFAPVPLLLGKKRVFMDVGEGKDGVKGVDNIKEALLAFNAAGESYPVQWIMADNTLHEVTEKDLGRALIDFNKRKQSVFAAYVSWRAGDKQKPFVMVED